MSEDNAVWALIPGTTKWELLSAPTDAETETFSPWKWMNDIHAQEFPNRSPMEDSSVHTDGEHSDNVSHEAGKEGPDSMIRAAFDSELGSDDSCKSKK